MFSLLGAKIFGGLSLVLLIALGGGYLWHMAEVASLENKVKTATNARDTAVNDKNAISLQLREAVTARDVALNTNNENLKTIEALKQEKLNSEKVISKLNDDRRILRQSIDSVMSKVVMNTKLEDGPIAPVLKETIRAIQVKPTAPVQPAPPVGPTK